MLFYLQPMTAELALLVVARCEHPLASLEGSWHEMWKLLILKNQSGTSPIVQEQILNFGVALSTIDTFRASFKVFARCELPLINLKGF